LRLQESMRNDRGHPGELDTTGDPLLDDVPGMDHHLEAELRYPSRCLAVTGRRLREASKTRPECSRRRVDGVEQSGARQSTGRSDLEGGAALELLEPERGAKRAAEG